jgi:hypothetical protein
MSAQVLPLDLLRRFSYTSHGAEVNEVVASQLHKVATALIDAMGDRLEALFVIGSFGRGEGGVVVRPGALRAVNDFDLLAVVRQGSQFSSGGNLIADLLHALADEVSVKQIDLALSTRWRLAIPANSVSRYEMRWGHRLLAGRPITIRAAPARLIPLSEGARYFRTRGCGLLIARLLLDGSGHFSAERRAELVKIELNKAALAIGDAALIAARRYHFSYAERGRRVAALVGCDALLPHELDMYASAVAWQLRPTFDNLGLAQLERTWHEITSAFLDYFRRFESHRLRLTLRTWDEYSHHITRDSVACYQRTQLMALIPGEHRYDKMRAIMVGLLAACLRRDDAALGNVGALLQCDLASGTWDRQFRHLALRFLHTWHSAGLVSELT